MRPKGWKNPFNTDELTGKTCSEIFEAGADAMLEGLKKEGTRIVEGEGYCAPCGVCSNNEDCIACDTGYLVLIEE